MGELPPSRRFPPPWSIEDIGACFLVKDATGQKLAAVYYGAPIVGQAAHARRGAADRGELPEAAGTSRALNLPGALLTCRELGRAGRLIPRRPPSP
jgi:hypothetical protein